MPDHPLDSILDAWNLPVNEEADRTTTELEICEQLSSMDRMDPIDRFVFDEYAFINQEIDPIATIKYHLFVADRNGIFYADIETAQSEFIPQTLLINGLQQSWPKGFMD
jgi:hypothetical protein